eukprot:452971-Alexandrium_andersonii.AAC.1
MRRAKRGWRWDPEESEEDEQDMWHGPGSASSWGVGGTYGFPAPGAGSSTDRLPTTGEEAVAGLSSAAGSGGMRH